MSEVVRVSPDGSRVLVQVADDSYGVVAAGTGNVQLFSSLQDARTGRNWQKPSDSQLRLFASAPELVQAALTELAISEQPRSESRRVYRVPQSVRDEAKRGLRWAQLQGASAELLAVAEQLAKSVSIGVDDVQRIAETRLESSIDTLSTGYARADEGYPNRSRIDHALLGGQAGEAWVNKLARTHKLTIIASAFTYNPDTVYMAGGADPDSTKVTHLFSVVRDDSDSDFADDDAWSEYVDGSWSAMDAAPDDAQMIELNQESATALANWLDSADDRTDADNPYFELQDINPIERNLFDLARPHLDWTEIDRAASLAATDGIYTPQERSGNAQRQSRSAGGQFGSGPGSAAPATTDDSAPAPTQAKAHLDAPLPLVDDVNGLIQQYLSSLSAPTPDAEPDETDPVRAAGEPAPAPADAPVAPSDGPPSPGEAPPLYLAEVDQADTSAVLELIALVPADESNSDVTAYTRTKGQWVSAPDVLADLRGDTPPPVVELPDPAVVANVVSQVDASDGPEQAPAAPAPAPTPVAASGWGGLFGEFGEMVPIYSASGGLHRAVLVAAGIPGIEDTPSDKVATDRLRRYWSHGEGAAKIMWGTPGDLTRCHREINKYMSGERAWGFCQLRHREATGEWNKD